MPLSTCPGCGADYPAFHSPRDSIETLCDECGYTSQPNPQQIMAIADVLYEVGAGEHLHAQQRADYRRGVAREILDRLTAMGYSITREGEL